MEVSEQIKQLNQLLNPTAPKVARVELNLFKHVWQPLLRHANIAEEVEPEPLKLCNILIGKLQRTIENLIGNKETHRRVREALNALLEEIRECPHADNITDSIGAVKGYVEELALKVYERLDCRKVCEGERGKACTNSCNYAIETIISTINQVGFLLDTCYDKNRFGRLYQKVRELLNCQANTALISIVAALTMMEALGLHGGRWLYMLAAQKLGLPLHPWLGDVVAILYAANAVNVLKVDNSSVEITPSTIGEIVRVFLECG